MDSTTTILSFFDKQRPSKRYWTVFTTLCVGSCLDYFDFFIVGFLVASLSAGGT